MTEKGEVVSVGDYRTADRRTALGGEEWLFGSRVGSGRAGVAGGDWDSAGVG
jgi:hypothetical protein